MLRLGIVGLPNVGKSTLFNALTSAKALVANYPFATIEPNTGIVQVPDPRLDALARIVTPERTVPAAVEFVDIAGPGEGREPGRGPRQPVPRQHPRGGRHRPRGPLLRGRRHPARHGRRGSGRATGRSSTSSSAWPISPASRSGSTRRPAPRGPVIPRPSWRPGCSSGRARRWPPGGRRASWSRPRRRRAAFRSFNLLTAKPVLYAANVAETDIAAGNRFVRGAPGGARARRRDGRGGHLLRQGRGRAGRAAAGGPGRVPRVARPRPSRASIAWPTRPTTCSASRATSPPARRRSGPGPSTAATGRRPPPG